MTAANKLIQNHSFLEEMINDSYFPNHLVKKGVLILESLCNLIESTSPSGLPELYSLTHSATHAFNKLEEEFLRNDSEFETEAREIIGAEFEFIAKAYGFSEADIEELIEPRNW